METSFSELLFFYSFYTYSTKIHTSGIRTSGDRTSGGPPVLGTTIMPFKSKDTYRLKDLIIPKCKFFSLRSKTLHKSFGMLKKE